MIETPDFANPPIVEMVLGAQFSPLTKLSAGHFGLFWKELGSDWTDPGDGMPIQDQFELFDRPRTTGAEFLLQPIQLPARLTLGNKNKDRILQIQSTRFCLNWKKQEGLYPSYKRLIGEFRELYNRFRFFTEQHGLGTLALNQWEMTCIDAFPKGEYWDTPADWASLLPDLFGQVFSEGKSEIALEQWIAQWSYEIRPKRGRLHITVTPGRFGDDKRDALLLQMTARGPVGKGGVETLREGLDLGHDIAFDTFIRVVSDEAKKNWEKKP